MRLLLLEDDPRQRAAYARRLRNDGHDVDEVITLAGTRAAIAEVAYDGLVLDRRVPDGDALDLVAELERQPHRPLILLLSALTDADEQARALDLGADDYVPKPVHLDELAVRVMNLPTHGSI